MWGVSVIVTSYNRPRMLREALASIRGAAQILVVDDGSEFDLQEAFRGLPLPELALLQAPPRSVADRLTRARTGALINQALQQVRYPLVAYLNDDDLFTPEWLPAVTQFFLDHPEAHVVRGDWYAFPDGEPLSHAFPNGMDVRQLTMGNFAHRSACFQEEGVRWSEEAVAVLDDPFLRNLDRVHPWQEIPHLGVRAGYRRLHDRNMVYHTVGWEYAPSAAEILAAGLLE